jgi:hypothetical protein
MPANTKIDVTFLATQRFSVCWGTRTVAEVSCTTSLARCVAPYFFEIFVASQIFRIELLLKESKRIPFCVGSRLSSCWGLIYSQYDALAAQSPNSQAMEQKRLYLKYCQRSYRHAAQNYSH